MYIYIYSTGCAAEPAWRRQREPNEKLLAPPRQCHPNASPGVRRPEDTDSRLAFAQYATICVCMCICRYSDTYAYTCNLVICRSVYMLRHF